MDNHSHKKKWGQNFIQDENIIQKIIEVISPKSDDNIIEVGPGRGALTKHLINSNQLTVIEIDPILCSYLNEKFQSKLELINDDILNIDLCNYTGYNKIVGNLPYYITTPILFKVLQKSFFKEAVFMVQKEVAERIVASPGNKIYGRLSVMIQAFAEVKREFNISKNIFYPKPKVESTLIKIYIKENNGIKNINIFSNIVKKAFGQRRKILKNSLKDTIPIDTYYKYMNMRPEELTVCDYLEISNNI